MKENIGIKVSHFISSPEKKRSYNEKHFTESAPRYDIATRGLSLGQDTAWKRLLVSALPKLEHPICLDLACGTGDVAFRLAEEFPEGKVIGVDLTEEMLKIARKRNPFQSVSFVRGDMGELNYPDNSIDIVTGSYALRNAPSLTETLREICRVIKPGGAAAFLDFSKPSNRALQSCQYWLLKFWGSFWGLILHGNPEIHGYISASIRNYPDRASLFVLFEESGFEVLKRRKLFFGMVELTELRKKPNNLAAASS